MARIRSIKPEFWSAGQVLECSRNARLAFVGLWNFCDDKGRHKADCRELKAQVFPGDDDVTAALVHEWIEELVTSKLLVEYQVDGALFWQVTGWHHQRIDKPQKPKYPGPEEGIPRTFQECSQNTPAGSEGSEGSDRKGSEKRKPSSRAKEKTQSARATRLPADWIPPEEYLSWAQENGNGLDLAYEVAEFRDFWSARAGRDSTKLDWFATWRNHIRRQTKRHRPGVAENGRRLTPAERGLLAMKDK